MSVQSTCYFLFCSISYYTTLYDRKCTTFNREYIVSFFLWGEETLTKSSTVGFQDIKPTEMTQSACF